MFVELGQDVRVRKLKGQPLVTLLVNSMVTLILTIGNNDVWIQKVMLKNSKVSGEALSAKSVVFGRADATRTRSIYFSLLVAIVSYL